MIGCTNHSCTRSARSCIHTKCPVTPRCNPTNCPHFCDAGGGQWRGLFHLVFVGTLIVILFVQFVLSLLCWVGFTSYLMNKVSSIYVKQVQWKIDFSIGRLHVFLFSHTHRTLYIIRLSSDCDPRQSLRLTARGKVESIQQSCKWTLGEVFTTRAFSWLKGPSRDLLLDVKTSPKVHSEL